MIEDFGVSIYSNALLESLSGLDGMGSFGNSLYLGNMSRFNNFEGLPSVPMTLRNLTLFNLPSVTSLEKLGQMASHSSTASIELSYLPSLPSLKGLEGFKEISNLVMTHNAKLADVKALSQSKITGPLILVDDNGSLCDFTGLKENAAKVNGSRVFDTCGTPSQVLTPPPVRNSGLSIFYKNGLGAALLALAFLF